MIAGTAQAQRLAVIAPDRTESSRHAGELIADSMSTRLRIVDSSLADTAFASAGVEDPFNLSLDEAKRAGAAIGTQGYILVKSETIRRSSTARDSYYESYAVVFLVNSRSGHLVSWTIVQEEANSAERSQQQLETSRKATAANISGDCAERLRTDDLRIPTADLPELPVEGTDAAKGFRAPVPYLRIKPEYTRQAFLYGAKGTVEIAVDLDDKGNILATEIERWAGFGLDESVTGTVRKMNWRPAEHAGKALPMRFLLRYNFKKVEKE